VVSYRSLSTTVGTTTSSATEVSFGAMAELFLGQPRFTDSWVLSPYILYSIASGTSTSSTGLSLGVDAGYQWFWNSGFNMAVGLGMQYISIDYSKVIAGSSLSGVIPSIRFGVGYSF
jgi:hypothetical protein